MKKSMLPYTNMTGINFDKLFDFNWNNFPFFNATNSSLDLLKSFNYPTINMYETGTDYEVEVNVAGFGKDEIKIEVNDGFLIVSGKRVIPEKRKGEYVVYESFYTETINRKIELPKNIDVSLIEARHDNGILHLLLPKSDKQLSQKTIEIK